MAVHDALRNFTLNEICSRTDPKGNAALIAEILAETNPIMQHAPMVQANDIYRHEITQRISLPKGEQRQFNAGVSSDTSHTRQISEYIGMHESYSEIDKALAEAHAGGSNAARMQEARAHIEGMAQAQAYNMFYGNKGNADVKGVVTGFASRLSAVKGTKNSIYSNVIDAAGTTDLTSVYAVQWGVGRAAVIFPKSHTTGGIEHEALGQVTLTDANGKKYEGFRDHFLSHQGLGVWNPKCIARLGNIDLQAAMNDDNVMKGIISKLIFMTNGMYLGGQGARLYCHPDMLSALQAYAANKANIFFAERVEKMGEGLSSYNIQTFNSRPIYACDAIQIGEEDIAPITPLVAPLRASMSVGVSFNTPEGTPSIDWTANELTAWGAERGLNLYGTKDAMMSKINEYLEGGNQ